MSRPRKPLSRGLRWALAGVVVIALAAVPAGAGMFSYTNDYEGLVERDRGTYFGFDVVRRGEATKVARVTARLAYTCTSGSGGRASARARGKLRITDGTFAGTLEVPPDQIPVRARGGPGTMTYAVAGELRRRGRARGTIDAVIRFSEAPRGGPGLRCYSGKVDWRARRGADVEPVFPKP